MSEQKSVCPLCRGAGFVRRDLPPGDPDFGRALPCSCSRQEIQTRRETLLQELSNLGALSRLTFDSFKSDGYGMQPELRSNLHFAYDICQHYISNLESSPPWLVLMGNYGCGKTHLAAAIANHYIAEGGQPLFVVVPDLLDYLRSTYAPSSAVGYDERFDQVRNASLLILDDLGTQNTTAWAQEKLFQIFNHRYNAQLPTVITTNFTLEDLDIRIRSRMADPALSQVVVIRAPDFRQSGVDQYTSDMSSLPLLAHLNFDNFDLRALDLSETERERIRQVYNTCRRFAGEPSGWLVLVGDYGVGKTHLAAAIANSFQDRGKQALFIVVPDLLDHLRATFNPNSAVSYDKRFEEIRRSALLVLDDLGTQSATPWAQEKLFQLFNYRYMARLPTIITLNSIEHVEPRLLERIMQMKAVGFGNMLELRVPPFHGDRSGGNGASGNGRTVRGGRRRDEFFR